MLAGFVALALAACTHDDGSAQQLDWGPVVDAPALVVFEGTSLDALTTGAVCSAGIVDGVVVTAAHCLDMGSVDVVVLPNGTCDADGATRLNVGEPYDTGKDRGDLAILPIRDDFDATQPVAINVEYAALGWATVQSSGIRTCGLHATEVDIVAGSHCAEAGATPAEPSKPETICARAVGQDVCSGDSGGPLVDADGRIAGVVSRGAGCKQNGYSEYAAVCPALDQAIPGSCERKSVSATSPARS
ncbi:MULTISPECIES: S1 family peptidase [Demequina]|uniref:S1 family peptidase n=1 Tax=Demequina TaxID=577469 RepID=UPI000784851F|nr:MULTISPECIES: S1 family peptidase [Demequina]